jgi:hypothetical protein
MAGCAAGQLCGSLEGMLKVDQVHVIRHKVLVDGRSQRQVAKEFGISRLTVRKYVTEAVLVRKETAPRPRPVWDAVGPRMDPLLAESAQWTVARGFGDAVVIGSTHCAGTLRVKEFLMRNGHPFANIDLDPDAEAPKGVDHGSPARH